MKTAAHQAARWIHVLDPASYGAAAIAYSSGFDTRGYRECLIVVQCGVFTATGDCVWTVQHSNDNSTFADIDLNGDSTNDAIITEKTVTEDSLSYVGRIDLTAVRRYLRVSYDVDDDACIFGIGAILLDPINPPATQVNTVEFNVDQDAR